MRSLFSSPKIAIIAASLSALSAAISASTAASGVAKVSCGAASRGERNSEDQRQREPAHVRPEIGMFMGDALPSMLGNGRMKVLPASTPATATAAAPATTATATSTTAATAVGRSCATAPAGHRTAARCPARAVHLRLPPRPGAVSRHRAARPAAASGAAAHRHAARGLRASGLHRRPTRCPRICARPAAPPPAPCGDRCADARPPRRRPLPATAGTAIAGTSGRGRLADRVRDLAGLLVRLPGGAAAGRQLARAAAVDVPVLMLVLRLMLMLASPP